MQIEVIRDLRERKMQIVLDEREGGYGIELLNYTSIEGIVGPMELGVDGKVHYIYSFGDKIPISEYIKKENPDEKKIYQLFHQILQIIQNVEEYFLVPEDIMIRWDCIFVDSKEEKLYMAYFDGYQADVADEMAKITEELMNIMDHSNRSLTFLIYGIHKICREENFMLNKLETYLAEYHYEPAVAPTLNENIKKETKPVKEENKKKKRSRKEIIIIVVVLGCMAWYFGWLDKWFILDTFVPEYRKAAVFVSMVVLLCCGYFVLYGKREKKKTRSKDIQWENERNPRTLFLKSEDQRDPEIHICQSPYYIGSDATSVDSTILKEDVSGIHVKIILEEKEVFIIDQESSQGTYVNEKRLVPWECRRLQNGDMVAISSHRYQAVVSSDG